MKTKSSFFLFGISMLIPLIFGCQKADKGTDKPRILISSDIGGTDPDDFQSLIHLLMYADHFRIEGLVSSPFGGGRKEDFLNIINQYSKDYEKLLKHAPSLPSPATLESITKQGSVDAAPFRGYNESTAGSDWIVSCAKKDSDQALWVLVWGGLEDLAQALHDAPEIKQNIKVYWIGGPNKKWSINAYSYIAEHHPDLWMIEANATYRGWIIDQDSPEKLKKDQFYTNYIEGRGALGRDFYHYLNGEIKMGDTPSLAYLMNGNPDDPTGESWGGSFRKINRSSRSIFEGGSTTSDTVATYATIEWHFIGPKLEVPEDSVVFQIEIQNQLWPGYYLGDNKYGVKYSPKKAESGTYKTSSNIPQLNGLEGAYTSIAPWPGQAKPSDYPLGGHWYSDRLEADLFLQGQQGAKTISKHREAFMLDWAEKWDWLEENPN